MSAIAYIVRRPVESAELHRSGEMEGLIDQVFICQPRRVASGQKGNFSCGKSRLFNVNNVRHFPPKRL